jgi:hypothetical protein
MGTKVFYMFGRMSDGSPNVYDDTEDFDRYRFYDCDTIADLPVDNLYDTDFAIVRETGDIYFCRNETWVPVLNEAWPIHSAFFTDSDTNPARILGYGTWSGLGKVPSMNAWGWKRTV